MKKNYTIPRNAGILLLFCIGSSQAATAGTIYVNHAASGGNNGTTWADAYTDLTLALNTASAGDELWVAQGVYKPSVPVDLDASGGTDTREAVFVIPDGVALFGGFAGTELSIGERDWSVRTTILSGDIDNNDWNVDANNIAESAAHIVGENAYHLLFTDNTGTGSRLDGFIVTAGSATIDTPLIPDNPNPNLSGGGWLNRLGGIVNSSSPAIANCTFQGNCAAYNGGAFYTIPGAEGAAMFSWISNSRFIANEAGNTGGALYIGSFDPGNYHPYLLHCEFIGNSALRRGGALYLMGDHAQIDSCIFENNQVTIISMAGETSPGSGGAVNLVASNAHFIHSIFTENSATGNPTGAGEGGGGGAIHISTNEPQTTDLGVSNPLFIGCGFYGNIASGNTTSWGGAVVHLNDAGILDPAYVNCVFFGNTAQTDGGAVYNFTRVISPPSGFTPELKPRFTNCTFTNNQTSQRGGAFHNHGFEFLGSEILDSEIENCILWGNTAGVEGDELYITGNNQVSYSLIAGSGGSGGGWNSDFGTDGGNNIDADPDFVDETDQLGIDNKPATNDDGLRVTMTSPAADHGNDAAAGLIGITGDYAGDARYLGSAVDMGAYEIAGIIIPDLDIFWLEEWRPYLPNCLSCPWSIFLIDRIYRPYVWDGTAQLVVEGEKALITGKIIEAGGGKSSGFDVHLEFNNPADWTEWSAMKRTYTAFSLEAYEIAKLTHKDWMYWELSPNSYLLGTGNISGRLQLKHWPANFRTGFQVGAAANGWDRDFGMSGLFSYLGGVWVNGKYTKLFGIGSMNVDAIPCISGCIPLARPSDDELMKENVVPFIMMENGNQFLIYPNPATDFVTIQEISDEHTGYTFQLYNLQGKLLITEKIADEEEYRLSVADLERGLYLIRLISSEGLESSQILSVE